MVGGVSCILAGLCCVIFTVPAPNPKKKQKIKSNQKRGKMENQNP